MIQRKKYYNTIFIDEDGVLLENIKYNKKINKYFNEKEVFKLKEITKEIEYDRTGTEIIRPIKILQFVRKRIVELTIDFNEFKI